MNVCAAASSGLFETGVGVGSSEQIKGATSDKGWAGVIDGTIPASLSTKVALSRREAGNTSFRKGDMVIQYFHKHRLTYILFH